MKFNWADLFLDVKQCGTQRRWLRFLVSTMLELSHFSLYSLTRIFPSKSKCNTDFGTLYTFLLITNDYGCEILPGKDRDSSHCTVQQLSLCFSKGLARLRNLWQVL